MRFFPHCCAGNKSIEYRGQIQTPLLSTTRGSHGTLLVLDHGLSAQHRVIQLRTCPSEHPRLERPSRETQGAAWGASCLRVWTESTATRSSCEGRPKKHSRSKRPGRLRAGSMPSGLRTSSYSYLHTVLPKHVLRKRLDA